MFPFLKWRNWSFKRGRHPASREKSWTYTQVSLAQGLTVNQEQGRGGVRPLGLAGCCPLWCPAGRAVLSAEGEWPGTSAIPPRPQGDV